MWASNRDMLAFSLKGPKKKCLVASRCSGNRGCQMKPSSLIINACVPSNVPWPIAKVVERSLDFVIVKCKFSLDSGASLECPLYGVKQNSLNFSANLLPRKSKFSLVLGDAKVVFGKLRCFVRLMMEVVRIALQLTTTFFCSVTLLLLKQGLCQNLSHLDLFVKLDLPKLLVILLNHLLRHRQKNHSRCKMRQQVRKINVKLLLAALYPVPKCQKKDPFELIECGGHGKCGFNSVAVGIALQHNKDRARTIADASHLGAQLRVTLNSYFERHGHLAFHFEPNSSTEAQCDGSVPQTWEAYVKAVLRPGFWCDALCLLGLARRLQQRFVVIMWNPELGAWERKATIGTKKGVPIVLALRDSHYQLVQPWSGQSFPDDWLHAKEDLDVHLIDLTGGMPASSRASWIPPSTVVKSPSRASWIPPSSVEPIKSPSTRLRKPKVSGSTRSCQTPGAKPASIRSLQCGPAVACNKLWWRCPACPFQLEHRTDDHLPQFAINQTEAWSLWNLCTMLPSSNTLEGIHLELPIRRLLDVKMLFVLTSKYCLGSINKSGSSPIRCVVNLIVGLLSKGRVVHLL